MRFFSRGPVQAGTGDGASAGRKRRPGLIRVKGKRRPRDLSCIAPGCRNKSKGPRFHYLCDKHMETPKKQYEQWRKDKMSDRRDSFAI